MMHPAAHLDRAGHPWLDDAGVAMLWQMLQTPADPTPALLLVGGCVRNAIQGKPVTDYDLATLHTPDAVMARLEQGGLRVIPTGIDHGTVTARIAGKAYEITTLREDVATDGRHAVVRFGTDWTRDAARRDFTLNALYADRAGSVFDPLGTGLADARAGRVRFIGDPDERVREDALRILRFIRFSCQYGAPAHGIDAAGLAACIRLRAGLKRLSRERITAELIKMISVDNNMDIFGLIQKNNLFPFQFNILYPIADRLLFLDAQKKYLNKWGNELFLYRLPIWMDGIDRFVDHCLDKLSLSSQNKEKIKIFCSLVINEDFASQLRIKQLIYKYNHPVVLNAALWRWVACGYRVDDAADWLVPLIDWPVPVFPMTGDDLIAQGHSPGPALGATLRALEDQWIANDFQLPDGVV